jgi:oligopeptide/dipeptide ABC transporter ATP-binding protein
VNLPLTKPEPRSGGASGHHLLEVDGLSVEFRTDYGTVRAVRDVSWHLDRGETLAILGESGSGKSVSAQAIMGILESPPARITSGAIRFNGTDLLTLPGEEQRAVRGAQISMVFQDALSALNPVFTVGSQIAEMFRVHRGTSKKEALEKAAELMDRVRIPGARSRVKDYPHQFSGGQRQRIGIARALALKPEIIVCDEPVSALDVSVQAQVINLLEDLQNEFGLSYLFIAHDLSVVRHISDRVNVMYLGRIIESGDNADVYERPAHPYTQALLSSVPSHDPALRGQKKRIMLSGDLPSPVNPPSGCHFRTRCWKAQDVCAEEYPALTDRGQGHRSACHFADAVDVIHGELPLAPDGGGKRPGEY